MRNCDSPSIRVLYAAQEPGPLDMIYLRSLVAQTGIETTLLSFDHRPASPCDPGAIEGLRVIHEPGYRPGYRHRVARNPATIAANRFDLMRAERRMLRSLRRATAELHPALIVAPIVHMAGLAVARSGFHPWICMPRGCDLLVVPQRSPLHRRRALRVLRCCDAIVTPSLFARRAVHDLDPALAAKTYEGPYGVDTACFRFDGHARAEWRAAHGLGDAEVLLFSRGFRDVYGFDTFVEALALARVRRPKLRALVLGDAAAPEAAAARALVRGRGIGDIVTFVPPLPHRRMPRIYAAADLFVQTNRSDECPASLLEALSCERPVVSTALACYRPMLCDDIDVIEQAPVGDAGALADCFDRWLDADMERRAALLRRGRQVVCRHYEWQTNFPVLVEQLRQTIAVAAGQRPWLDPEQRPAEILERMKSRAARSGASRSQGARTTVGGP